MSDVKNLANKADILDLDSYFYPFFCFLFFVFLFFRSFLNSSGAYYEHEHDLARSRQRWILLLFAIIIIITFWRRLNGRDDDISTSSNGGDAIRKR